jgi:hypothetical protein
MPCSQGLGCFQQRLIQREIHGRIIKSQFEITHRLSICNGQAKFERKPLVHKQN